MIVFKQGVEVRVSFIVAYEGEPVLGLLSNSTDATLNATIQVWMVKNGTTILQYPTLKLADLREVSAANLPGIYSLRIPASVLDTQGELIISINGPLFDTYTMKGMVYSNDLSGLDGNVASLTSSVSNQDALILDTNTRVINTEGLVSGLDVDLGAIPDALVDIKDVVDGIDVKIDNIDTGLDLGPVNQSLAEIKGNTISIEGKIDGMDMGTMPSDLAYIKTSVGLDLAGELGTVGADVTAIKSSVGNNIKFTVDANNTYLRANELTVNSIYGDTANIKNTLTGLDTTTLNNRLTGIKTVTDRTEMKVDAINADLDLGPISTSINAIETSVGTGLGTKVSSIQNTVAALPNITTKVNDTNNKIIPVHTSITNSTGTGILNRVTAIQTKLVDLDNITSKVESTDNTVTGIGQEVLRLNNITAKVDDSNTRVRAIQTSVDVGLSSKVDTVVNQLDGFDLNTMAALIQDINDALIGVDFGDIPDTLIDIQAEIDLIKSSVGTGTRARLEQTYLALKDVETSVGTGLGTATAAIRTSVGTGLRTAVTAIQNTLNDLDVNVDLSPVTNSLNVIEGKTDVIQTSVGVEAGASSTGLHAKINELSTSVGTGLGDKVGDIKTSVNTELSTKVEAIQSSVGTGLRTAVTGIDQKANNIILSVGTDLKGKLEDVQVSVGPALDIKLDGVSNNIDAIQASVGMDLDGTVSNIDTKLDNINFQDILTPLDELDAKVLDIQTDIEDLTPKIVNTDSLVIAIENSLEGVHTKIDSQQVAINDLVDMTKRVLGLSLENYKITAGSYDIRGNLLNATIEIFETNDLEGAVLETYQMNSRYNVAGRLIDYKVAKV